MKYRSSSLRKQKALGKKPAPLTIFTEVCFENPQNTASLRLKSRLAEKQPACNTQGHSECDDVCDARLLDCDARNVLCDVAVFDCFVTEENVIWSKQLE